MKVRHVAWVILFMVVGLLVQHISCLELSSEHGSSAGAKCGSASGAQTINQFISPPPSSVPPNASRITATVRQYTVWPPGSLRKRLPPVPADQTLYSLTVQVDTSEPENSELENLAVPDSTIEVFSDFPLTSRLVNQQIQATIRMTGDTRGVRWVIVKVLSLP